MHTPPVKIEIKFAMLDTDLAVSFRTALRFAAATVYLFLVTTVNAAPASRSRPGQVSHPIHAGDRWNPTGISVLAGKTYTFRFEPSCDLADAGIPVRDLRGWPPGWERIVFAPLTIFRRRPFDPWFALIVTVDRRHPQRLRPVSPETPCLARYRAPADGQLVCYFNDLPGKFFLDNNHGSAVLRRMP